jgi:hypothetical protein
MNFLGRRAKMVLSLEEGSTRGSKANGGCESFARTTW